MVGVIALGNAPLSFTLRGISENLRKQLLDRGGRFVFVQMHGVEAERVDERVGLLGAVMRLEHSHSASDHDGTLLVERTTRIHVVVQNDAAGDGAEAQHRLLLAELRGLVARDHRVARVGKSSEELRQVVHRDGVAACQRGGVLDHRVHHRRRIRKEETHRVGQFVADGDARVALVRQLDAVQNTAVVREVVLNGRIRHLTKV